MDVTSRKFFSWNTYKPCKHCHMAGYGIRSLYHKSNPGQGGDGLTLKEEDAWEQQQEEGLGFLHSVSHFFMNSDFWLQDDLPSPSPSIHRASLLKRTHPSKQDPLPSRVHPCQHISPASLPFLLKTPLSQPGTHLPSESVASARLITRENRTIRFLAERRLYERH